MSKNKEENITFEQAIEELETIINRLEEGDVPLDETIKLYEKGSELKDFCEKKLQSAEVKIQKINHQVMIHDSRFMSPDSFMIIFRSTQSCFLLKLGGSLFGFEEILESERNVSQSNRSQYGIWC